MTKISLKGSLIVILLLSVFVLPKIYPVGIAVYFRLFLLFLILIESVKLFKTVFIDRQVNKFASNLGTVIFSFLIFFICLEMISMFIPKSNPVFNTLASQLYYEKYFKPLNYLGFRDDPPPTPKATSQHIILFVGDSFTAGYGLKHVEERFSNIVGKELNKNGQNYTVVNLGKEGLNSKEEYDVLRKFLHVTKIKPEIIVWQYFGDDIRDTAENTTTEETFNAYNPFTTNRFLLSIIRGSYLFDYLYWSYHQSTEVPYLAKLMQAYKQEYKDDYILSKHKEDLMRMIDYAKKNSIKLIVVVFPYMNALEMSDSMYVNDLVNYFQVNKVDVINVSPVIKNIPVSERIINDQDAHASRKVNRIVANEIIKNYHKIRLY